MKYTIVVQCPVSQRSLHQCALRFVEALLRKGHRVERVFFYGDGVLLANACAVPGQDELDTLKAWQTLISTHGLDVVVCIAAALKRGILDDTERSRYEKPAAVLPQGFELSGLGQLVEAMAKSDRTMTFG